MRWDPAFQLLALMDRHPGVFLSKADKKPFPCSVKVWWWRNKGCIDGASSTALRLLFIVHREIPPPHALPIANLWNSSVPSKSDNAWPGWAGKNCRDAIVQENSKMRKGL